MYGHPMNRASAKLAAQNSGMGFEIPYLKELEDKAHDYMDSAKDQLKEWGVSDSDINAIEDQAKKEFEEEKKKAGQELLEQVTGAKGTFEPTKTGSGIIPKNIQEQVDRLNQNPVLAAIPGGVYTVAGVGALGIAYLIFRR